jgi:hypothetical protein
MVGQAGRTEVIYGPDDKPIVNPVLKAMNSALEGWCRKNTLEALQKKFCFTDWWGPRLYDARGNQIEWPNWPKIGDGLVKTGRTIQFYSSNP